MKETTFWKQLKSGRFAEMVRESSKGKTICSPVEAYNILRPLFAENDDVETVYFIFLDTKNQILAIEKMFTGTIDRANVYPREVIKRVIALRASGALMAHNHPSGDTRPSAEDMAFTRSVIFSLTAIDVSLHDHLIIGNGYHSMSEDGWVNSFKDECRKFVSSGSLPMMTTGKAA